MTFITILPTSSPPVRMRSSMSISPERAHPPLPPKKQEEEERNNGKCKVSKNGRFFTYLQRSGWTFRCSVVFSLLFVSTFYISFSTGNSNRLSTTQEVLTYSDTAAATEAKVVRRHNRPYFVLHIGPPKSATTTLQYDLTHYQDVLYSEDAKYTYLGNTMNNPHDMWDHGHAPLLNLLLHRPCMRQVNHIRTFHPHATLDAYPECWKRVRNILAEYRERNESIIISEEFLSIRYAQMEDGTEPTSIDWAALAQVLEEQEWNPVVLVGYRRLFDILPSAKQQWDRFYRGNLPLTLWPGEGGRTLEPLFPNVLSDPRLYKGYTSKEKRSKDIIPWSYTDHLVRTIAPFLPVRILALHQREGSSSFSLRENFFCHVLPAAPKSCAQARLQQAQESGETVFNQEESLFYDALGCAAADRDWVDKDKYERRPLAMAMQAYHEQHASPDFPLTCPSDESTKVLLELSLAKEEELFAPQWVKAWRQNHIAHFYRNRDKKKFCWIDTDAALEQPLWKDFFENELDAYMQEQQQIIDEETKDDDDGKTNELPHGETDYAYADNGGQAQKGYKFRYEEPKKHQ